MTFEDGLIHIGDSFCFNGCSDSMAIPDDDQFGEIIIVYDDEQEQCDEAHVEDCAGLVVITTQWDFYLVHVADGHWGSVDRVGPTGLGVATIH